MVAVAPATRVRFAHEKWAPMGFREALNRNRALATGITAAILFLAVAFILYRVLGYDQPVVERPTQAWYSADDGATYFADDFNKNVPFKTADGKTAFRAYVYQCGEGGTPFVNHLERPSQGGGAVPGRTGGGSAPPAASGANSEPSASPYAQSYGRGGGGAMVVEVKKPGQGKWVSSRDVQAVGIMKASCPDGSQPTQVQP